MTEPLTIGALVNIAAPAHNSGLSILMLANAIGEHRWQATVRLVPCLLSELRDSHRPAYVAHSDVSQADAIRRAMAQLAGQCSPVSAEVPDA